MSDGTTYLQSIFHDPHSHAQALRGWDQTYEQLSAGPYVGQVRALGGLGVQVVQERVNRVLRQSSYGRPRHLTVAFSLEPAAQVTSQGDALPARTIVLANERDEIDLVAPAGFTSFAVSVSEDALPASVRDCLCAQRSHRASVRTVALDVHHELLVRASAMLDQAHNPGHYERSQPLAGQALDLIEMVAQTLIPADQLVRQSAVRLFARARALAFAAVDAGNAPSVELICQELSVSRRTVQNVFLQVVGLSPLQYLKIARLNAARADLVACSADRPSVGEVATRWGFWHHSQFSRDYFRFFGELPVQTLRARRSVFGD
jgi:AraC family transcriptional regulator, ethanolamine operon transcriptional activator